MSQVWLPCRFWASDIKSSGRGRKSSPLRPLTSWIKRLRQHRGWNIIPVDYLVVPDFLASTGSESLGGLTWFVWWLAGKIANLRSREWVEKPIAKRRYIQTMQLQAEVVVNQPGAGRCSMTVSNSSGQAPSFFYSPLSFDVFWSASPFWQLDLPLSTLFKANESDLI